MGSKKINKKDVLLRTVDKGEGTMSYWDETGVYQKDYDKLYASLVPTSGSADTIHGELIRGISRIQYDYCNNGNCNIREVEEVVDYCDWCYGEGTERQDCLDCNGSGVTGEEEDDEDECESCGGSGEELVDCESCGGSGDGEESEGEVEVSGYYTKFIDLIKYEVGDEAIDDVIEVIETVAYGDQTFNGDEYNAYNKMCDMVIHHVLTTEDAKLPKSYEKG